MVKSSEIVVAFALALSAMPAAAAGIDLAPDQGSELRSRADGLLAERQRNPAWDGGTTRLNPTKGDVDLSPGRGEMKTPQQGEVKPKPKGSKRPKSEPMGRKMKRTASELPGALVRKP